MSVLLIPNPTKDTGLAVTRQAAAVLAGLGVPVLMPQPFANEFGSAGLTGVHFLPEADAYRAADQVVTIGGDGTLLRADEITPDSCRLWEQRDHSGKVEHLDKDLFRRDLGDIIPAYEEIESRLAELAKSEGIEVAE